MASIYAVVLGHLRPASAASAASEAISCYLITCHLRLIEVTTSIQPPRPFVTSHKSFIQHCKQSIFQSSQSSQKQPKVAKVTKIAESSQKELKAVMVIKIAKIAKKPNKPKQPLQPKQRFSRKFLFLFGQFLTSIKRSRKYHKTIHLQISEA